MRQLRSDAAVNEFWERVDACLDQRRDPLDDAWICDQLYEHLDWLEDFAVEVGLRRALTQGSAARIATWRPTSQRRRASIVVLAAALLCVVGVFALRAWQRNPGLRGDDGRAVRLPRFSEDARLRRFVGSTMTMTGERTHRSSFVEAGTFARSTLTTLEHTTPRIEASHGHAVHVVLAAFTSELLKSQD